MRSLLSLPRQSGYCAERLALIKLRLLCVRGTQQAICTVVQCLLRSYGDPLHLVSHDIRSDAVQTHRPSKVRVSGQHIRQLQTPNMYRQSSELQSLQGGSNSSKCPRLLTARQLNQEGQP